MKKEGCLIKENKLKAFTTAEVLLSISVFLIVVVGLAGAYSYSVQSASTATIMARANYIANEGLEATRNIRDANFFNLSNGTYGLSTAGGTWSFSGTSDIVDIFTRQTTISTIDANTRQATVSITWPSSFGSNSITQSQYFTDWRRFVATIGNWANPSIQSFINPLDSGTIVSLKQSGNYIFAVRNTATNNFIVIDISNLASPVQVATLTVSPTPSYVSISNNYAYISSSSDTQELVVVNIANPLIPSLAGSLDLTGNADAQGTYIVGNVLYLLRSQSSEHEYYSIDIANPSAPVVLSSIQSTNTANRMYVLGNYAYIASSNNGQEVEILNITNPSSISSAGAFNLSGNSDAISINSFGTTLAVGRVGGELALINATNPTSLSLISTYTAGGDIREIAFGNTNQYIFLATLHTTQEFKVVDITNIQTPVLLGNLNMAGGLYTITYDSIQDRAYAGGVDTNPEFVIVRPN